MQRLARRILAVVALFVLVVAAMLVVRTRAARMEPVGPRPSNADLSIKDVQLEEESGGVRWRLQADQASTYEPEGRTALRKVRVVVDERTRSWTIVGEEGDLFQQTKNFEVRRNVVLTSDDGLHLETSVLRWQGAERRMWTDAPVRIYRNGAVVEGTSMTVRMNEEATTVHGPVHATFSEGGARP